jgi:hypothetical protein
MKSSKKVLILPLRVVDDFEAILDRCETRRFGLAGDESRSGTVRAFVYDTFVNRIELIKEGSMP